MQSASVAATESRARRAARRVGLVAVKSRSQRNSVGNQGGFALLDPYTNGIIAGERCDLSAVEMIDFCQSRQPD